MARDYMHHIINPEDPGGPGIDAVIPGRVYSYHHKHNLTKYENLRAAKAVLDAPLLVFAGVREFNEGGWAFVGQPKDVFIRPQVVAPLPPGFVFAVYLNPAFRVYDWRLEPVDEADGVPYPKDHMERYERVAWRSTS